jgi:predicted ribosome quality control (RQC) complex YloA/Tae2 family protein
LNRNIEHFCKIKKYNNFGSINDKRVLLNYAPQENISISSCQEYWKEDPIEFNNNLVGQTTAMPLKSDELTLPKEKQFGDNSYAAGLIEYKPLANLINDEYDDKINEEYLKKFDEKLINPITNEKLDYEYKLIKISNNFYLIN